MVLSLLLPLTTLDLPCKDLMSKELSSAPEFSFSSSSSETKDTVEALTLASFLLLHESLLGVAIKLRGKPLKQVMLPRYRTLVASASRGIVTPNNIEAVTETFTTQCFSI